MDDEKLVDCWLVESILKYNEIDCVYKVKMMIGEDKFVLFKLTSNWKKIKKHQTKISWNYSELFNNKWF